MNLPIDTPAALGVAFAPAPRPTAAMRLFCLPYAGGSAALFRGWPQHLRADVELVCVELPGRGRRFREPPLADAGTLADDLAFALLPWLDRPFALFGHSNGALIAFEVARRLRDRGHTPDLFFASAKNAPALIAGAAPPLHSLPRAALLDALRRLGGTPAGFLDDPELVDLYLPILRADIALGETYRYRVAAPLRAGLVTLSGSRDPCMDEAAIAAWRRDFQGPSTHCEIEGGHFFIDEHPGAVLAVINEQLGFAVARCECLPALTVAPASRL